MLKSTFGEIAMKSRQRQKDILFSLIVFFSAFAVNLLIQKLFTTQTLVPMIFVFGVFLISLKTHGYCYGITSAIVSVFAVDFAFTYPYYVFGFFVEESILSAVIMMVVAVSTSTLNIRIRDQEKLRSENEKERMRGNLLRAISHDLRTPLTSIYGSSSTLLSKYDELPKEQQLKLLGEIQEDSEWLIRMVENLLSVTRIDGAKVKVVKTPTVLDELIDSVLMKFSKKHDETDKIMKAQMARCADFESGGLIKKAKSLVPLLVPLFISAFRRANDLAMAMEARGYRGGELSGGNRYQPKSLLAISCPAAS